MFCCLIQLVHVTRDLSIRLLQELLAQWNVWDPLLERTRESEQIVRYPLGHEGLHQSLLSRVQAALNRLAHARHAAAATTTNDEL